jgi:very-short-patch-repair endonuclease
MDREATKKRARRLRSNPSATERTLWDRLRQRRLGGLKFRRQMPTGSYVLDFVCLRFRLVVEADGPFHDPDRDAIRDGWLKEKGFRVLKFTNREIQGEPELVANRILTALDELPPVATI